MKYTKYLYPLLILLAIACYDPGGGGEPQNNVIPSWIYDRIYEIENDTLQSPLDCTGKIWRYDYNDQDVYYFSSYRCYDADHYFYDKNGTLLGRGFSGWTPPDELFLDIYHNKTNGLLLWEYSQTMNYRTPNWIINLIDNSEKGTDSTLTNSIWRYDYEGYPVYLLSTSVYQDYHRVYNIYGHYLGAPFGGPRNEGDGLLSDFFEERSNQTFIWENSNYPILAPSEEYAVINAAMLDVFSDYNPIHVLNLTDNSYMVPDIIKSSLENESVDFDTSMIDQYIQNNNSIYYLDEDELSSPIELISIEELYDLTPYGSWTAYWDLYPNSSDVLTLSRPGFDYDSTMAILEYGWQMTPLSGSGAYVLLEKIQGVWEVVLTRGTWMSKK